MLTGCHPKICLTELVDWLLCTANHSLDNMLVDILCQIGHELTNLLKFSNAKAFCYMVQRDAL